MDVPAPACRRLSAAAVFVAAGLILTSAGCHRAGGPPVQSTPGSAPVEKPLPEPPAKEIVPEEGGEGTFALEDPFTSVAAPRLATSSDRFLRGLAFRGLTRMDATGRIEAELALQWEMLQDGIEWVFHLRPETQFTNGRYLEARHVVASWEKLILASDSPDAWLLEPVKGYEEARAGKSPHVSGLVLEDGLTLRVALRRPLRNFPARLAHPALGISAFGEDVEGIGPFQIWGTPKPSLVVLRSNPEYFHGLPHLDEIAFVRGEAAGRDRIPTGSLDLAVLGPSEKASPDSLARVFTHAAGRVYLLGLNRAAGPFSRGGTALRFVRSLDRRSLAQALAGELGSVPATLLVDAAGEKGMAVTPAPAEATPAGLGRLDLIYPEGDRPAARLAEELGTRIAKSGGRVFPHAVRASDFSGALDRREFHLFIVPSLSTTLDPLLRLQEMIRWNRSIPPTMLAAFVELESEGDPSRIATGLASLDASLREQGYLVPLARVPRRFLVAKGICGLRPDPIGTLDWTRVWRSRRAGGECD